MQSLNMTTANIEKIAKLFPNVVTEKENEKWEIVKAIDFDLLKQQLSTDLVEDENERYSLNWPGKKSSILKANTPINKTLRPIKEDSVDFDETENLYIEWDNFEVLKLLQESYLWKIKMIYIDPPYNTGTAMIYNNDFSKNIDEYDEEVWAVDENWYVMFKNTDSNWRFHSDWLSMMYERLVISRDLLKEDWFIALAIDHNELHNLTSMCDEVFWEENRLWVVSVIHKPGWRNQEKFFASSNEFMLVYSKNKQLANFNKVALDDESKSRFKYNDDNWSYDLINFLRDHIDNLREKKPNLWYPLYVSPDLKEISVEKIDWYNEILPISNSWREMSWKTSKDTFLEDYKNNEFIVKNEDWKIVIYKKFREQQIIKTHWDSKRYNFTSQWTKVLMDLMWWKTFDFPKSLYLVVDILKLTTSKNDIILDFFSGSSTTAHAVMNLNAEDCWNRKFIMIQLPEKTLEDSDAFKAWYKNICEIAKERIRRAGKKILEENKDKLSERESPLDIWFRVYRLADSNMKDVYYNPISLWQQDLFELENNIKDDRNSDDLLAQVMLDLWLTLDLPIETRNMNWNKVYFVQENLLVACFDDNVNFEIVDKIAEFEPIKVVFKDSSFKYDKDRINLETRFKRLCPTTKINVL